MIPSDKESGGLPPITRDSKGSSSPDSDDGKGAYIPSIGLSGYRSLRKQASKTSSPPSRRSSMQSSTASSPTKFPTLDSTRFSVTSTGSSQSVKPGARDSTCRSPSCSVFYSDLDDDVISPDATVPDFNASIHPRTSRRQGYPTNLKLPEIFNAGAPTQKIISQDTKRFGTWTRANPNVLNMTQYLQRKEAVGIKRQTSSSVGSSVGSSPTKSDYELNHFYNGSSNALLLPLRENRRRKKRKHSKQSQNLTRNSISNGKAPPSRTVHPSKDKFPGLGKWQAGCGDSSSDESGESDVSDGLVIYDQDVVLDKIAMENKVKFGCMKSLCDLDGE